MRPITLDVVTPELASAGGTERVVREHLSRWNDIFTVRVITADRNARTSTTAPTVSVWRAPGPHILGFAWWSFGNAFARARARRNRPDVTFSPGINCFDADAIGIHIIFAQHG